MAKLFSGIEYPSLAGMSKLNVLRLIRSENVGPITFFSLISRYGNAEDALTAAQELSLKGGRKKPIALCSSATIEKELEATEAFGAEVVLYGEAAYPKHLLQISDPPAALIVKGHKSLWQSGRVIGMVGTRNASANGFNFTRKLSEELGRAGYIVASGLARGIDTAAHNGSLPTGTVAVIAGGIDNLYPPENKELYHKIYDAGAVITEQPYGAAPLPHNFLSRNRIIAGMSLGVVVVEASLRSGSLTTARLALDSNREVFAVPGSPLDPRCRGSNDLIRQGAVMVESIDDILPTLQRCEQYAMQEAAPPPFKPATLQEPNENELNETRRLVAQKLGAEAVLVDELLVQCQLTPNLLLTVLLELELAGRLERHPGNKVSLKYI